jgi:hypothetical protein
VAVAPCGRGQITHSGSDLVTQGCHGAYEGSAGDFDQLYVYQDSGASLSIGYPSRLRAAYLGATQF